MTKPKFPTMIPALVGAHIRDLRLAKPLSLRQVESLGGPTPSQMSVIERGKSDFTIGSLIKIAKVLDVHPSALLPDELFVDEPQTPKKTA